MDSENEKFNTKFKHRSKTSAKGSKEGPLGRSRTILLPTRCAGSRVRFRERENDDDAVRPSPHPTTPRSSELRWIRDIRVEHNKSMRSGSQWTSHGQSPHGVLPSTSHSPGPSQGSSGRGSSTSSPRMSESKLYGKAKRAWSGRGCERRSRSLVIREPRRRSSSVLSGSHLPHASGRGITFQESFCSSRDSDRGRGRTSLPFELGRSLSDRASRLKTHRSIGGKRAESMYSPARLPECKPQSDQLRHVNIELAMASPEEETMEQMFKLKSNCSGSDPEMMSMKGIVSSLIAIENEEL